MFTKSNDGIITFQDTSDITPEQWTLMMRRMNHIGYGFPDEKSVKDYFDRGYPINKDQSDIVLAVLKNKKSAFKQDKRKAERYIRKSKEQFGTTKDWRSAGYVLTDGTMLDFSAGQRRRVCDHRDIRDIVTNPRPIDHCSENTSAMIEFINYGHVRCQDCGFEVANRLTPEQRETIEKYMWSDGWINVDIMGPDGNTVKSIEYHAWRPRKIFKDIDDYFDSLETI